MVPEFVQLEEGETAWNAGILSIPQAAVLQVQVDSASGETPLENVSVAVYLIDENCADQQDDCSFDANEAETYGGAIATSETALTIDNGAFQANDAGVNGGGVQGLLGHDEAPPANGRRVGR